MKINANDFFGRTLSGRKERDPGKNQRCDPVGADPAPEASGGTILGRYSVIGELGRGGMGVVWKCFDTIAKVEVAIKSLPSGVAVNGETMEDMRNNFRLVSGLRHPSIAGMRHFDVDGATGRVYLILDCVQGQNLRRWAMSRKGPGGIDGKLGVISDIASALDYAHGMMIVHRDIKPENVMVDLDGRAVVLDFGIASQIQWKKSGCPEDDVSGGTPSYMSPEQWLGLRQGPASDQFSLAVLAYELISGSLPFAGEGEVLRRNVLEGAVAPIEGVPAGVNAALAKAMSKEEGGRFDTCGEFAAALSSALAQRRAENSAGDEVRLYDAPGGKRQDTGKIAFRFLEADVFPWLESISCGDEAKRFAREILSAGPQTGRRAAMRLLLSLAAGRDAASGTNFPDAYAFAVPDMLFDLSHPAISRNHSPLDRFKPAALNGTEGRAVSSLDEEMAFEALSRLKEYSALSPDRIRGMSGNTVAAAIDSAARRWVRAAAHEPEFADGMDFSDLAEGLRDSSASGSAVERAVSELVLDASALASSPPECDLAVLEWLDGCGAKAGDRRFVQRLVSGCALPDWTYSRLAKEIFSLVARAAATFPGGIPAADGIPALFRDFVRRRAHPVAQPVTARSGRMSVSDRRLFAYAMMKLDGAQNWECPDPVSVSVAGAVEILNSAARAWVREALRTRNIAHSQFKSVFSGDRHWHAKARNNDINTAVEAAVYELVLDDEAVFCGRTFF